MEKAASACKDICSKIPAELAEIDSIKWSEEVRLGSYLIEISLGIAPKVEPWNIGFFLLAKQLFSRLDEQTKKALTLSYNSGEVCSRLKTVEVIGRHFFELYQSNMSDDQLRFALEIDTKIGEHLDIIDYKFLYSHQNGCNGIDLSHHLVDVIGSTTAMTALRRGWLIGEKTGRHWHIPFSEVLRAISLARNWSSTRCLGLANQVNPCCFRRFVSDNYEMRANLSGALAMRTIEAPEAIRAYKHSIQEKRRHGGARSFDRFAKRGELSPETFGDIFGVSDVTVRNWFHKGHIHGIRRKDCLFIKRKEVKVFARKVLKGEALTISEVIRQSNIILTTQ